MESNPVKPVVQANAIRCHVVITKDDEDLYSAIALNLPGVGSCGTSEEEAIANAKEAIRAAVAWYLEREGTVPWLSPGEYEADIPDGCRLVWILADA